MARLNHANQGGESQNPTQKYIKWKSNDKSFSYYDKAKGEEVKIGLPFKFVFLQHYHTVKGWHDSSNSAIYSNEVYYIGNESMTVRAFKGGEIASGIYKEIKSKVNSSGGSYHRSVYIALEDGSIANLSIKGAVVKEWSDFIDASKNTIDNQWVVVNEAVDQKKGSVSYSTPKFSLGDNLDKKAVSMADDAADKLKVYMDEYFVRGNKEVDEPVTLADDLAF
ncbi:MAG TPA: hypothetical protein DCY51_03485 [Bacteroidetes bacterium]|mgnify:CR=1 FL=1|nr:hypothetical protein [Bacteroidota bacterium]